VISSTLHRIWIASKENTWIISGLLLGGIFMLLAFISSGFGYGIDPLKEPIVSMTSLLVVAATIYLYLSRFFETVQSSKELLIWIVAIGVGLRIAMIFSTPMLEDDYFRYLWDGAVTADGINPYTFAPQSIIDGDPGVPDAIRKLAVESGDVVKRVNHPQIRTIYPPVTQLFFAASHLLSPWNLLGWKFVLLAVDLVSLILLLSMLRFLGLSYAWIAVYWWNPLLVKEIFNSGHMDILIIPFVFGAVLLLLKNRPLLSSIPLAFGIGIKLWPLLLLPFFLKRIYPNYRKMILFFLIFTLISIVLFVPIHISGIDDTSGFQIYAKSWENNDAFFMAVVWMWKIILPVFGIHPGHGQFAGRLTVLGMLVSLILFLIRRKAESDTNFMNQCLVVVAAGFLVSPTQFPWYFVWVIPFLTVKPTFPLLILTALLPLYYLRYYLEPRGIISLFNHGIVWLEFVPVWILLIRNWINSSKVMPKAETVVSQ
jgi:alpha-1,6-mannosyltransferase